MKDRRKEPIGTTRSGGAEYLGVKVKKIDRLIASGQLKAWKLGRHKQSRIMILCRDLDAWLERQPIVGGGTVYDLKERG